MLTTHEVRIHKFKGTHSYVEVPNLIAFDERMSFGAKGLLTYLLSLPPGADLRKKTIIKNQKVTRTFLDRYLSELEHFGYIDTQVHGYVYIVSDTSHPYLKIGFSVNPKIREKTLQAQCPTLEMIHLVNGTHRHERIIHKRLAKFRRRGEWFDVPYDVALKTVVEVCAPF